MTEAAAYSPQIIKATMPPKKLQAIPATQAEASNNYKSPYTFGYHPTPFKYQARFFVIHKIDNVLTSWERPVDLVKRGGSRGVM